MNPNPVSTSAPLPRLQEGTALLSTKPPFVVSLLRVLMSISGIITLLLAGLAYSEILPEQYAVYTGLATGILLAAQRFVVDIGDILDDGVKNGSFPGSKKPDENPANPSTLRQWYLFPFLLGCLALASCTTAGKSSTQLQLADIGYTAAQGALIVAEATLQDKLADPDTPAWQRLAAQLAVGQAKKAVSREQAKIDAAFAALLAGKVPPELAMPTYVPASGKTALDLLP